jgi:hypothetical protein
MNRQRSVLVGTIVLFLFSLCSVFPPSRALADPPCEGHEDAYNDGLSYGGMLLEGCDSEGNLSGRTVAAYSYCQMAWVQEADRDCCLDGACMSLSQCYEGDRPETVGYCYFF